MLSESSLARIKGAIDDELAIGPYRRFASRDQRSKIDKRLDRLLSGEQILGSAEALSFVTETET